MPLILVDRKRKSEREDMKMIFNDKSEVSFTGHKSGWWLNNNIHCILPVYT